MHDLVIRGGSVVDGNGTPAKTADLAVSDGRIVEVGRVSGSAHRTIDADGLLVTPGWVDIHTHYDGQVSWDPELAPSIWHGVSTALMGNCGVGFAPATPERHRWLIGLMEGVEDIPGEALEAGMPWGWESYGEYLDVLEKLPRTMDVGGLVGHGAVRAYAMGDRGANNELATPEEIERMAAVVKQSVEDGAFGFSSSRTILHTSVDGEPVPGTFAAPEELVAIARAVKSTGRGLVEVAPAGVVGEDSDALIPETEMMIEIARETGCPVMFLLVQHNSQPDQWKDQLALCRAARSEGIEIIPQVGARPPSILFSFQGENPFEYLPSFQPLKDLPHEQKVAALRDPETKRMLLSEKDPNTTGMSILYQHELVWDRTYKMGRPLCYTPAADQSIAAEARLTGKDPREVVYDLLLEGEGKNFLMHTVTNYADGNADAMNAMIRSPDSVLGLSDAGAHVRQIVDAGIHTYMLTDWVRDVPEGHPYAMSLEFVVRKLTRDNAELFKLDDRGVLAPGMKADINLIDYENLALDYPDIVVDLPAELPRLMQTATGYVASFVSGEAVQERGEVTGARPGRVIRSGD